MKKILYTTLIGLTLMSCNNVPEPAGFGALPSKAQVEWQKMEYNMFIHFGPNTFTGAEWGDGREKAEIFNPTALDCGQWASIAKNAGMKSIIITAKHHDGFCLWPNPVCNHTVAQSPWRDGKGDVLKDLSEACREYSLDFGIYISPWDRNDPHYGTDEYNDVFVKTLEDALGNYGKVSEQWFDGACGEGPNGKVQVYDWPRFNSTVYKLQPDAIIFGNAGPGCRWVGNESGSAGRTCWSTINVPEGPEIPDLSRKEMNEGTKGGNRWAAAETDVSIRPGWFWRESENSRVKSLQHLLKIYYESVGRNSLLLLNVPADTRGLIHETDSTRLMELRAALDKIFSVDLASGGKVSADNVRGDSRRYKAQNILNKDYDRYWATDDSVTCASFTVTLPEARTFNRVQLQEYIPLGQRVSAFTIEALTEDGTWTPIAKETTIGYKRIVHVPATTAEAIRVNIEESEACPVINGFALFMDNIYTSYEMSNIPSGETKNATEPLVADLGEVSAIRGFVYAPKVNGEDGVIVDYKVEISDDGITWTPISSILTFNNIVNNPISQEVTASAPFNTRFLRVIPVRVLATNGSTNTDSETYGVSTFGCLY